MPDDISLRNILRQSILCQRFSCSEYSSWKNSLTRNYSLRNLLCQNILRRSTTCSIHSSLDQFWLVIFFAYIIFARYIICQIFFCWSISLSEYFAGKLFVKVTSLGIFFFQNILRRKVLHRRIICLETLFFKTFLAGA
jgi:hypothetical protein